MIRTFLISLMFAALSAAAALAQAPDPVTWRALDPEDTLYIDTRHGRIVVELYPEIAPRHVSRVRTLARQGFYDGLAFHRVIEGFMAQGGDPKGDGSGASELPDLEEEFLFRRGPEMPFVEAAQQDSLRLGFFKTLPIASQPDQVMAITRDGRASAWGMHCPGVASMARASEPNSANSQFFLMRAAYPSLDKRYTIWGRVVWGQEWVMRLAVGEPPPAPDTMLAVRVAADLPEAERAPIYVMRTDSPAFSDVIDRARREAERDRTRIFGLCDVQVPVRVAGDGRADRPWWRAIPGF